MESESLFLVQQQFYLGDYRALASQRPHDPTELIYVIRALFALHKSDEALALIPSGSQNLSHRALRSLASYISSKSDEHLEELRDLCLEVEGEDISSVDTSTIKVSSATAFFLAGEIEEALSTLGAGTSSKDIECVALIVHIYLMINRADLARREYLAATKYADDALLIQMVEASIGLLTGANTYSAPYALFTEQASHPTSSTNPHLLAGRGVAQLLRGNHAEAIADFEQVLKDSASPDDTADTLANAVVAHSVSGGKPNAGDEYLNRLKKEFPSHPFLVKLEAQSRVFDEAAANYTVPALATTSA